MDRVGPAWLQGCMAAWLRGRVAVPYTLRRVSVARGKVESCRRYRQTGFKRRKKLLKVVQPGARSHEPGAAQVGGLDGCRGGIQETEGEACTFLLTLKFASPS